MGSRRTGASGERGWVAYVVLAVIAFVVLHALAKQPISNSRSESPTVLLKFMGVSTAEFKDAARAAQYMLPLILLSMDAWTAVRQRESKAQRDQSAQFQSAAAIDGMTWHQLELRVGEAYRQQGYTVVEMGGSGPDGGVDLVLRKPSTNGSETFLVQCKHWLAYKVSVNVVRELYGVMAARGAAGGFVVTSGRFTSEAVALAQGRHVTLVDGAALKALLETAKLEPHLTPAPSASVWPKLTTMVVCPLCSHAMVLRTARRGPNAGEAFYGCSTYLACKGTRLA